jgi:TRAP transporter 4TM/12TM fusion protein
VRRGRRERRGRAGGLSEESAHNGKPGTAAPRAVSRVGTVCGFLLCLISITFSAQVPIALGIPLFTEQGLSAILGLAICVIFVAQPARRGTVRTAVPCYDAIAATLGLAMGLYMAFRYPLLVDQFFYMKTEAFIIGIVLLPLTIEALRRTAGWSFTAIVLAFLVYALVGDVVPGYLKARTQSLYNIVGFLTVDSTAMVGLPLTIIGTIVIMFVFLGQLLLKSGASEWFTDIATALMGGRRGGSAKIAVVASGFFGMISGSAVSNVASVGVITIPLMRRGGYDPKVAGAFEAVASTGGQIMPPVMGAAAFLMAEILQMSYAEVAIAAIIPAVLYYTAVFIYADLEAARKKIAPLPRDMIPPLGRVLKEGWFFLLPIALLVYALFTLNRTPEESALWAAGAVVVVNWIFGYKGRRLRPRDILLALRDTGTAVVDVVVIGAMAGIIIGIIDTTGLGFGLTFLLVEFGQHELFGLLVLTALICIVLGMGMPTTAIYLLVATLAAPPLIKLGINPLAAHMFVFYFGLVSLITPPVAIAAFVAANLAGAGPMETAVQAVRLGWTALVVPVMFVLSPSLIMQGRPIDVVVAAFTAFAGVWIATAGILGYFTRPMQLPLRLAFLVAGIALMVPTGAFASAAYVESIGFVLAAALAGSELLASRRLKRAAATETLQPR